jgi:hypothetical protein
MDFIMVLSYLFISSLVYDPFLIHAASKGCYVNDKLEKEVVRRGRGLI